MKQSDLKRMAETRVGKAILVGILVIIAFVLGQYWSRDRHGAVPLVPAQKETSSSEAQPVPPQQQRAEARKATLWTCAMHPQIRLPKPGKCPICFMDLIPLEDDKHDHGDLTLSSYKMSETAKKLAGVETTEVKRERAKVSVRMVGMVVEAETKIAALTARIDGRLDKVFVNFTGEEVKKGDPMVEIWSPTLIKSQVELFESIRSSDAEEVVKGAEEKLIQYGLTREQVAEIREKQKPILNITLRAPISGIVMKKMALLGQFVKEGQDMYTINDLSTVWVTMDAYETDLPWIRYGQDVTFTTPAAPGQTFRGKVLFINPTLETRTRTVKIRVEAENPDYKLRPGMFVTAQLEAEIDASGRVIKREWAGKYVCPVHPKDEASPTPGLCPDSNMPLKPVAAFGYSDEEDPTLPIVAPSSAPLITGKRAIVYVEVPGTDQPTYELREVVLGPRAGDRYVVYEGLKEGEKVVSRGNFKIDSALQIVGKPSMMRPGEVKQAKEPTHKAEDELIEKISAAPAFLEQLTPVIEEYLSLKDALVEEKSPDAAKHAQTLAGLIKEVKSDLLDEKAKESWNKLSGSLVEELPRISDSTDVNIQRKAFDPLSETFAKILMGFRHVRPGPVFLYHCPMAFGEKGAYWIDNKESHDKRNPYFGNKPFKGQDMLKCGELVESIPPEAAKTKVSEKADQESVPKPGEASVEAQSGGGKNGSPPAPEKHGQGRGSHSEGETR